MKRPDPNDAEAVRYLRLTVQRPDHTQAIEVPFAVRRDCVAHEDEDSLLRDLEAPLPPFLADLYTPLEHVSWYLSVVDSDEGVLGVARLAWMEQRGKWALVSWTVLPKWSAPHGVVPLALWGAVVRFCANNGADTLHALLFEDEADNLQITGCRPWWPKVNQEGDQLHIGGRRYFICDLESYAERLSAKHSWSYDLFFGAGMPNLVAFPESFEVSW